MLPTKDSESVWIICAGAGAKQVERFLAHGQVAFGWNQLGQSEPGVSRAAITEKVAEQGPGYKKGKIGIIAGQLFRFITKVKVGEWVTTYAPGRRIYTLGTIESGLEPNPSMNELAQIARKCHL